MPCFRLVFRLQEVLRKERMKYDRAALQALSEKTGKQATVGAAMHESIVSASNFFYYNFPRLRKRILFYMRQF